MPSAVRRSGYRVFSHTADVGLRAEGEDLAAVLANAAKGMFHLMVDLRRVRERQAVPVSARAENLEALLVAWLSDLLYRFEVERVLLRRFEIGKATPTEVRAVAYGETWDPERHPIHFALKGVTYHQIALLQSPRGWRARVIFDL